MNLMGEGLLAYVLMGLYCIGGSKCCREGYRRELCEQYEYLLSNSQMFFDKNECLNSDGKRVLERMLRMLLDTRPEHRRLVSLVRRKPCIDEVVKLGVLTFYNCDPLELYRAGRGLIEPYTYSPNL